MGRGASVAPARRRTPARAPAPLPLERARRIALAAQGFDRPRPTGRVDVRHVRRVARQLGLIQIDFVNVLVPAHYQVPFSRLGPYDRSLLDRLAYTRRDCTEQWAHEASILPVECWPLLRHRMARRRLRPRGIESFLDRHRGYAERVLAAVRERGPLSADEVPEFESGPGRIPGAWVGTVQRAVLEAYFARGRLAVVRRRADMARVFDLAERVIPTEYRRRRLHPAEAQRRLLQLAAGALGVATADDLADYYRMSAQEARPRIQELVKAGALDEVRVAGWQRPAYLDPGARCPPRIQAAALLSPFDPLVWHRPRVARLFDFEYRIEIFVPRAKRRWGYYVLPFLLEEQLVARADLRADRGAGCLRVAAAYEESGVDRDRVAAALADELRTMARWLGLETIAVARRGNLAPALARAARG